MYDNHTGHIAPEIWVGRIDFSNVDRSREAELTAYYFKKVMMYRAGQKWVPKRALIYVDDDWVGMEVGVNASLWRIYGDTSVVADPLTTNSADYLERLQDGYEWVHLQCHGWSGGHVFKTNGTWDGDVYSSDYRSIDPPVLFYQFFVCSGARFIETNYLAGSSIATSYGLLALGSSKTGSMLDFEDFYDRIFMGECIGDSFKAWFGEHTGYAWSRDWFYGMTLIGDPTLSPNLREARVEGYVKTQDGWPVSGIRVELRDFVNGTLYTEDRTDYLGHYRLRVNLGRGVIAAASVEIPSVPQGYFNYSSGRVSLSPDYSYIPRVWCLNVTLTRPYPGPGILVVVGNDGQYCVEPGVDPTSIAESLDDALLSYSLWNEREQGIPPMSLLKASGAIFWHTGTYWMRAIDERDRGHLLELLRAGKLSLVLEGEDIGYEFGNDTFLVDVGRVYYYVDDVGVDYLHVTNPEHPIAQGLPSIFKFPAKPPFLDGVSPRAKAGEVIRYYDNSRGMDTAFSAVVAFASGDIRVAFVSFPVAWLEETPRRQLIRNLALWVTGTPMNLHLVVRGMSNKVYRNPWNARWIGWQTIPDYTHNSLAVAVLDYKLHIVAAREDGSLYHGWIDLNTRGFSGWTRISGATSSAPALAASRDGLYLVVRGTNNRVYYRTWSLSLGQWSSWIPLPGSTSEGPSATVLNDKLHIVVRGFAGGLYHSYVSLSSGGFSGWTRISGDASSRPALAADLATGRLFLVVRGMNNRIYARGWNVDAGWSGWSVLPGSTSEGPGIAFLAGQLHIVVKGMSGGLYHGCLATSGFSGWARLSGDTPSSPSLASG
jgi:hypothetical protein